MGKGKGRRLRKERGKGWGWGMAMETGKGKELLNKPQGDHISDAMVAQLQMEKNEADSDMEGKLEQVNVELETLPAMSISSDDDTDSTLQWDGK
jgi:hypothetical protein